MSLLKINKKSQDKLEENVNITTMFLTSYSKHTVVECQISLKFFILFHSHLENVNIEKMYKRYS